MCSFLNPGGVLCVAGLAQPLVFLSLQGCHCVIHNSILTADEGGVDKGIFFHVTQSNWDQGFSIEALITLVSLTKNKFYFNQESCVSLASSECAMKALPFIHEYNKLRVSGNLCFPLFCLN